MKTIIKRYNNRRLYDTNLTEYIAVLELLKRPSDSFVVVDQKTKKDITDEVLFTAVALHFRDNPECFKGVKEILLAACGAV